MPIGTFLYCGKLDGYRLVSKTLDKTLGGRDGKLFPRGKHLTNPAAPRGAGQLSRHTGALALSLSIVTVSCTVAFVSILRAHVRLGVVHVTRQTSARVD